MLKKSTKPVIFETMVFKRSNKKTDFSEDLEQVRYSTLSQAKKGHKEMVKKYE